MAEETGEAQECLAWSLYATGGRGRDRQVFHPRRFHRGVPVPGEQDDALLRRLTPKPKGEYR